MNSNGNLDRDVYVHGAYACQARRIMGNLVREEGDFLNREGKVETIASGEKEGEQRKGAKLNGTENKQSNCSTLQARSYHIPSPSPLCSPRRFST